MIQRTGKTLQDYFAAAGRQAPERRGRRSGENFAGALEKAIRSRRRQDGAPTGMGIRDYMAAVGRKGSLEASGPGPGPKAPEAIPGSRDPEVDRHDRQGAGETGDSIDRSIAKASRKYDLPESLIRGVIRFESAFRADAVSPAGAQGLMQLMPATARELGVVDPFDVQQNIDGGSRYLRKMLDLFDGDVEKALAAYNAGPGTVRKYDGIPPYRETRRYVEKVVSYYRDSEAQAST
jgi:hypothetical protein